MAFFYAFWEHVLRERGGLRILLLDDPQELLDLENRERLGESIWKLNECGAQIIATSYDARFSAHLAGKSDDCDHREVTPATPQHPTIRAVPHVLKIRSLKGELEADPDNERCARDYANECRIYLEAKLGDVFEDPAFSTWVKEKPKPTFWDFVCRLRNELKANHGTMFDAPVFAKFCAHEDLSDGSEVVKLMSKSHHGRSSEIRANDVFRCRAGLQELVEFAEKMFDECCRWRRRDAEEGVSIDLDESQTGLEPLIGISYTGAQVSIYEDLAAFTSVETDGTTQARSTSLEAATLENTCSFYLRRENFGFAAPAGSIALVEANSDFVEDRRLVVARTGEKIYARRVLRSSESDRIALTAENPYPTKRNPKTEFLNQDSVELHRVIGVVFDHDLVVEPGADEAVPVDVSSIIEETRVAFRVRDESAVPLALPGQVVLGGRNIPLNEISRHEGRLVAIELSDGSGLFKRIGKALGGELEHFWQFESIGGLGSSIVLPVIDDVSSALTISSAGRFLAFFTRARNPP